ncbi:tetratricopeptide repeat (TPR)-like superfamily protein [Actinidia rufa]|uniref:Tetratricopeptide repeat (TPR)-like superfamily protein n=1 Tax=Actinidia rufa TaxID=165716 RepID=A0A7J0DVL3_9ERIC|nr:tetratricopeptide repeat (TPR)-like superfamily protein [Actinidia rufa]
MLVFNIENDNCVVKGLFKDGVPDLIRIAVDNDALVADFVFFRRGQLQDWEGDPVEKSMATLYGVGVGVTLEDVVRALSDLRWLPLDSPLAARPPVTSAGLHPCSPSSVRPSGIWICYFSENYSGMYRAFLAIIQGDSTQASAMTATLSASPIPSSSSVAPSSDSGNPDPLASRYPYPFSSSTASEGVLVSSWRPGLHSRQALFLLGGFVTIVGALIDVYFKCRDVEIAHNLFNQRSAIYIVICTAMISGYVLNGMSFNALDVFRWLLLQRTRSNAVTLASVLPSGACLAALRLDKELHGYIVKNGLEGTLHYGKEINVFMKRGAFTSFIFFAESALIDVYAKCGNLEFARGVFNMMQGKNKVSWNSIITPYGNQLRLKDSLELLHEMMEEGYQPDHVTFLAILSACGHADQVDEGNYFFRLMT